MRAMILQSAAARFGDLKNVMQEPSYARYAIGHFAATNGFWMQRIAVGWLTWELTGSEFWLGIMAFAELFPSLVSTFVGGQLADRFSRAQVMFVGQILQAVISLGLAILTLSGMQTIWTLLGAMMLLGLVAGAMLPARLSMPHLLVRSELLPSALAVSSTTFNLSRLLGPAVAAPLLFFSGAGSVFLSAALFNAVFVFLLARIATAAGKEKASQSGVTFFEVLKDLLATRIVLAVIALQFAQGMLIRPASELFPAFADTVFNAGESGLAILNAALGAGAMLGALAMSQNRNEHSALNTIFGVSVLHACALAAFAFAGNLWTGCLVLVVYGATMTTSNVAALSYVQLRTDPARMGRVLSVYGLVFRVAPALGAFAFGAVAEVSGLMTSSLVFAGLGLAGTLLLWSVVRREESRQMG